MRVFNSDFLIINEAPEKEPRYSLELSFDADNLDTVIITSHHDNDVPAGATVIYGALSSLSGTSQEVDPIKANSTIGDLSFTAADLSETLTSVIYSKLFPTPGVVGDGLRGKRVQLSVGFKGLAYEKYEIPSGGTQIVDGIEYNMRDGSYHFKCSDIQRILRKTICDTKKTTLLYTMSSTQTGVFVADPSAFETVFHGSGYSDAPNETIGYIDIKGEAISWRQKLETAVIVSGNDLSFSGSTIGAITTDLSGYSDKQLIIISGSASNDGTYTVTGTPAATSLNIVESLTTETAGSTVTVLADTQLYDCTRGALNTRAVPHEIVAGTDVSRRTKVEEVIYVQLPAVKALYAFLTGILYNDGATLPSHWHLGIDASYIETSAFIGIGGDWWDTGSDTVGVPANFQYLTKTDGKAFIERELLLLLGAFTPVTATGQLSLRRMTYVGVDSPYHHLLDESNVVSISPLKHDYRSVYNQFLLRWNWDPITKKFTRNELLVDNVSIAAHGASDIHELPFKGMHGATYTKLQAHLRRDSARDRYIGPPERITVVCSPEMNKAEIGDIVRLNLLNLQDFVEGGSINRSFEVQRVAIDWLTGRVTLTLFGSTERPTPLPTLASSTVIPNIWYTSEGVDISTVTSGTNVAGTWVINADSTIYGAGKMGDAGYAVGTVSATNGSKTVTGSGTSWAALTNTNIAIDGVTYKIDTIDSNTQITLDEVYAGTTGSGKTYNLHGAIYYWDGDMEVQASKTLFIHDNIQLRIKGQLTINGKVDGKGNGNLGGIGGVREAVSGYVGITKATGGFIVVNSREEPAVVGKNVGLPAINVEYDGSTVTGIQDLDARASSGNYGGGRKWWASFFPKTPAYDYGDNGGNGGAALSIVSRGVSAGVSSSIDLSGADGVACSTPPFSGIIPGSPNSVYGLFYRGSGAGGAASPLLVVLDGSIASSSDVYTHFEASLGDCPLIGAQPIDATLQVPRDVRYVYTSSTNDVYLSDGSAGPFHSYFAGYAAASQKSGLYREINLVDYSAPTTEVPSTAESATAINLSEGAASKQSLNLAAIEISVTPPTGSDSYYASAIYARETGAEAWVRVTTVVGTEERVVQVPNYNATYEFKANPISISGVEVDSGITAAISITSASLGANITTGGHIKAGQTGYDVGTGFFIGDDGGTWKISIGNDAGNKLLWNGTNLSITGTMTATAGAIGGWSITSTKISNSGFNIDSAGPSIYAGQTAYNTGTGFFLGNEAGTFKFSIGDPAGNNLVWDGSALSVNGSIVTTAGNIAGFGLSATGLSVGTGTAHLELDSAAGIWLGADLIGNAPFSVTPAGDLTAEAGTIGGWTINSSSLYAGSGVTRIQFQPGTGVWAGDNTFASAPFSITPAGVVKASSGTIGGWTLAATTLSSGGFTIDAGTNPNIRAGQTGYDTGTGFFLGDDASTFKLSIGNSAGNKLTWDGTTLAVTGSINSTSGSISGWTLSTTSLSTGTGASHLELDTSSGIWMGADLIGSAPFSVTPAGALKAESGTIGGWTLTASSLYVGAGATRIELNTSSGIWLGATAFASAPFSVTPAGLLKATSGTIGGWTVGSTTISAGTGTGHIEFNTTGGIWAGADNFVDAPFNVDASGTIKCESGLIGGWAVGATNISAGGLSIDSSSPAVKAGQGSYDSGTGFWFGNDSGTFKFSIGNSAGNKLTWDGTALDITGGITADSGAIGGWTIGSTTIESSNNRVILDSTNQRIQVQNVAGTNYVRMDANGLTGVDSVLGTVFTLPTDGSAPTFASGTINTTVFNITSSGILRTSSTVGDGSASGDGVLINDTGIKGFKASSSTPVFMLDSSNGQITALEAVISGGGITLSAGGAIKSTGKTIGTGSGFFLGYDSSSYQLDVGNHSTENFLQFDGTDLILGANTQLKGADYYNNDGELYYHHLFGLDIADFYTAASGSSSVAGWNGFVRLQTVLAGDECRLLKSLYYTIGSSSSGGYGWTVDRRFKTKVKFNGAAINAGRSLWIVTGAASGSSSFAAIGFKVVDGVLYGFSGRGSAQNLTASLGAVGTTSGYVLEAIFTAATSTIDYYVDGSYVASITGSGNMPFSNSKEVITLRNTYTTGTDASGSFDIGEVKVHIGDR